MIEFKLKNIEYIPLCDLLKASTICSSGGEAKTIIANGQVSVDGKIELRKRCKIRSNQIVVYDGQKIIVKQ